MTRRTLIWAVAILVVVALKFLLSQATHPVPAAAHHLLFGFIDFILRNAPRISVNADTLLPGLLAFLTAAIIAHGFFRSWAAKRNCAWSVRTTLALAGMLPLLFTVAFLVPGILLLLRALAASPHWGL